MKVNIKETRTVIEEMTLALDSEVAKEISKLATEKQHIDKELKSYINTWFAAISAMEDDTLYEEILVEYRTLILTSGWEKERVKHAADELVRRAHCMEANYSFEDLVAFYKQFAKIKADLHNYMPLWNAELDKGDDSYGDFIDSIQMVDVNLATYILEGVFLDKARDLVDVKQLKKFYNKAAKETALELNRLSISEDKLADYWWNGENYNAFMLIERLEKIAPMYAEDMIELTKEEV